MQHNKTNNIPKIKITPDISDFESDIDIDDLSQDFWHFILTKRRFLVFVSFPFSIVWLVITLYFYLYLISNHRSNVDQISEYIFAVAFAPLLLTMAAFVRIKLQFRDSFYEQFASLSNFDFHRLGNGVSICSLGTIFTVFPDCAIKDVVCGKFFSRDMNMYVYQSSKGYTSSITIMEVNIATLLPNILLVNKKSRLAGPLTRGFNHSGKSKAIILEGDFNQHFALYGNKKCNIEILQIFSPDFMQLLIDSSMEYSIEFCGMPEDSLLTDKKVCNKSIFNFDIIILMPAKNAIKVQIPESYYHVYARGSNRQKLFVSNSDYKYFLRLIERYLSEKPEVSKTGVLYPCYSSNLELVAYCLMSNHFHLLIYQKNTPFLEKFMRSLMTSYGKYFNLKYLRTGPVFESRYKAVHIDNEVCLQHISRYIHLNPRHWLGYKHSSMSYYINGNEPYWIKTNRTLEQFASRQKYLEFVSDYESMRDTLYDIKYLLADK